MAEYAYGEGADELVLYFQADFFAEPARINFGVLPSNEYVGNTAEYIAIEAARGSEDFDVVRIRGDFPADSSFFVSFVNDNFIEGEGDRNAFLVRSEINGVAIEGGAAEMFSDGDFGPFYFDGDAVAPAPEEPEEPAPGPEPVAGNLVLVGTAGDDTLVGGDGWDAIRGGAGDDTITTGGGRDAIGFGPGDGRDVVTDFAAGLDAVWTVPGARFEEAERDGVEGTAITLDADPAAELWLPGATGLSLVAVIA